MIERLLLVWVVAAACVAGCGGADAPAPAPTPVADPALARETPAAGEILIRGDLSPASHGPYELAGRYAVSFEQYAPEDPALDFSQQTSFVARLDTEAEGKTRESVRLFSTSRRTGRKRVELNGRYFVEVAFGDFPYVVRFTPLR